MSKTAEDKLPPIAPTTRWSIVVAAAAPGEDLEAGRQAMEQLCQMYWRPVLRFILRQGYPVHDAQDLTQDFFLTLCDADFLKKASPEKGHFRGLVFASLKNHLRDAADRLLAIKRGGGRQVIHLDEWVEEEAAVKEAAGASPEHLFDYDWAALIVRKALRQLHDEFAMRGKEREFDVVRTFLTGGERGNAYAQAATMLSLPVGTSSSRSSLASRP